MLVLVFLIAVAGGMAKTAKEYNQRSWVWVLLGLVAYIVAQFLVGIILGLFFPEILDNALYLTIIGVASGIAGVILARYLLIQQAKKKSLFSSKEEDVIDVF